MSELGLCQRLGLCSSLFGGYRKVILLDEIFLEIIPSEQFYESVEILLDLLLGELAFVDDVQPALEELDRHGQPGFLQQEITQLQREQIVALAAQLFRNFGIDERLELLGGFDVARRKSHLEELLVQLRLHEFADLGDFERKFGFDTLQFVLLDLQYGGTLRRSLVKFIDIDLRLEPDLLADERLALLLVHRNQSDVSALDLHIAVVERHLQRFVRRHLVGIHQTAETTQEIAAVIVVHLLIDLDRVVGHLIFRRQLEFHLGSFADLEDEFKFGPVLEIEVALLLRRDHVTDIIDLLLLQIVERCFRSLAVSLLRKHALAVHLLDHAHRHHTGTEARNIGLAFVLTQGFFDRIAVILLAYGHLDERVILLALFSYDIHISVVLYVTFRVGKSTK